MLVIIYKKVVFGDSKVSRAYEYKLITITGIIKLYNLAQDCNDMDDKR